MQVAATYPWPHDGPLVPAQTALIAIDMQRDFCAAGGWVDQLGESVENTARAIAPVSRALQIAREARLTVIHTREGHRRDLSDLNPVKQWRTRAHGLGIGDEGTAGRILVRGEEGHGLVDPCAALASELVIDKAGKSALYATPLDGVLRSQGIRNLVICGVTSDCCVQSTFRDAADLGYDALILTDATAAVEDHHHTGMLALLSAHGGRWGALASLTAFEAAVTRAAA
ncbi:MAG: cysteine hydrolase [Pseudomonadota bacterium]